MALWKPRYITHYFPLFDNSTDRDGCLIDRRDEVVEGVVTFHRNGIVMLGMNGFGFTRPIKNVKFGGGCMANRATCDQVLVIKSPSGEEFRYRYIRRDHNWYRLVVVERAPSRFTGGLHAIREEIADYGPVIGIMRGTFRACLALIWLLVSLMTALGCLALVVLGTAYGVRRGYGHLDAETIWGMIKLLWFAEGAVIGFVIVGNLAYSKGGRVFRLILPVVLMLSLVVLGYKLFPSTDAFVRTSMAFGALRLPHEPELR